jgi:phosphate transport system protein
MQESRHSYREALRDLEDEVLKALDLVRAQLSRALEALTDQDVELAGIVIGGDEQIDRTYLELHDAILTLMARQAPVASDLRLVAATLQIARCIERMGDQCVNIAKLVALTEDAAPKDTEILEAIEHMGKLADAQITQVKDALKTRHVFLARELVRQDEQIDRLNRTIFQRAVDIGDDPHLREWSMFMILAARALERIGDNTVDIAEQVAYIVTGLFKEPGAAASG